MFFKDLCLFFLENFFGFGNFFLEFKEFLEDGFILFIWGNVLFSFFFDVFGLVMMVLFFEEIMDKIGEFVIEW